MHAESFREHCLSYPGVTEDFPFDNATLVFKVMGKMFALGNLDEFVFINLKCDPDYALELREQYDAIRPGYHMSKKHWNSVYVDSGLPHQLILDLIDHSYHLVVKSLTKKLREELKLLESE